MKLNGADVADGTVITAIAEGDEYTTAFEINGYAADQTGTWQPGQNIRLDLTVSTASIPAASPNTWLIFALVIACIVEISVVGAVAHIVVRRWNRRYASSC